jgi:hypothetical protein
MLNWNLATGNGKRETGNYSYRNASIGSRRDALNAGNRPKKMPTLAEKPMPSASDHLGSEMAKPDSQWIRPWYCEARGSKCAVFQSPGH